MCLTAKADGSKLKPFIVFCGGKRECAKLHDEFKARCSVTTSVNSWMNDELTQRYLSEVLRRFSFSQRLLV